MKTLYFDCGMGAAGDMLTAALLELIDNQESFLNKLNGLGIPGVRYELTRTSKCGIFGNHISVFVNGEEEEKYMHNHHHHDHDHEHEHHHDHDHEHDHHHEHDHEHNHEHEHHHDHSHVHGHHHSGMHDIEHIVMGHLPVSDKVKKDIMNVYGLIADAESHAHGVPVSEIHFHEVGTMDAVADVTAVCMLFNEIGADKIIVSPIHVGSGQVHCAHGILSVPAPATAHILRDVPIYGGEIKGELCTPTGAALLKYFATDFGNMPVMKVEKIGYGMGNKDFEKANCVRVMLGETDSTANDEIYELSCNVDDMTAEEIGYAMNVLFEEGARDVYTMPIGMKKSRPGTLIHVMCKGTDKEKMVELLFKHTTTIGIREAKITRHIQSRRIEKLNTQYGEVRVKISEGHGVKKQKLEYEDLARIAKENNLSLYEVKELLNKKEF